MKCHRVIELLSAYIDSELTPDEISQIRSHLFKCNACDAEHRALVAARDALTNLSRPEPDDRLIQLIVCKPWEVGQDRNSHMSSRRQSLFKMRWAQATAAVLCLAVTAGVGLSTSGVLRVASQENLAKSFQAEHERFQYASPLSGAPSTTVDTLDSIAEDTSAYEANEVGSSPSDGLVTFVSHTTVE